MAASGSYLEIVDSQDDLVAGESEGRYYEGHIDITGWDWAVTDNASKTGSSGESGSRSRGAGPTKASTVGGEVGILPSLMTFTKPVDSATTRLMKAMYSG